MLEGQITVGAGVLATPRRLLYDGFALGGHMVNGERSLVKDVRTYFDVYGALMQLGVLGGEAAKA